MALQRYEPRSSVLRQFNDEISRLFDRPWDEFGNLAGLAAGWTPAVDLRETDDSYEIEAEVPGLDPQDIDITAENGVLTIQGERREERNKTEDNNGARHIERAYGSFVRRFSLPDMGDGEKDIDARVDKGVLKLSVKKRESSKPKRIKVKG